MFCVCTAGNVKLAAMPAANVAVAPAAAVVTELEEPKKGNLFISHNNIEVVWNSSINMGGCHVLLLIHLMTSCTLHFL